MLSTFKKLWNDERGNALLLAAAALPLVVGSAGLATDTIQWTLWKRQLQRAADSAAIAGVYQRVLTNTQTAVEGAVTTDLGKNQHTGIALLTGYPQVTLLSASGVQTQRVQVALAVRRPLAFSGMFLSQAPAIQANATAASVPGHDQYCIISLETNPSKVGITGTGNSAVEMDCGGITNDPSSNSAAANGSSSMTMSVIASVGGIQQSNNWHVGKYDPYITAMPDPYAAVSPDTAGMKCAQTTATQGNKTTVSMTALNENTDLTNAKDANGNKANCFTSLSVGSGKTLNLPAGTYYISGGDVNIQGAITGTDVTIVLTNVDPASTTIGTFKMNAGATANLTAPTTGTYAGIAVYQDRRATDANGSGSPNKINGNSSSTIIGALYFPKQELEYNGTGTLTAVCTRFVTRRIIFSGNNSTSNKFAKDCAGSGIPDWDGGRLVRLVA